MKNLVFWFSCFAFIAGFLVLASVDKAAAQQSRCSGGSEVSWLVDIPTEGTYRLWAKVQTVELSAKMYVYFNDNTGECIALNDRDQSEQWQWIKGQDDTSVVGLSPGKTRVHFVSFDGTVNLDSLLLTLDNDCEPVASGDNCYVQSLDVSIEGLGPNQKVTEQMNVEAFIRNETLDDISVSFFFNGSNEPFSVRQKPPYCLYITNGACASWSVDGLKQGTNELKVVVSDPETPYEQIIPFMYEDDTTENEVISKQEDPSKPTQTEHSAPRSNPTVVITKETEDNVPEAVVQVGAKDTPKVSGNIEVVPPTTTDVDTISSITYSVNGNDFANVDVRNQISRDNDLSAVLETDSLENGESTITARITDEDGSIQSYTSTVDVNNGFTAGIVASVSNNIAMFGALIVLSISATVGGLWAFNHFMGRKETMSHIDGTYTVSYTHLRAHETVLDLVCRLLLEKKK